MAVIELSGIKVYGFHGCFQEEQIIGQYYIIDIKIEVNIDEACKTDDLTKTINYTDIYNIVQLEMKVKSKLIEHVADRIKTVIINNYQQITKVEVSVKKPVPPVHGEIDFVKVTV